jgi:hypothetical protein
MVRQKMHTEILLGNMNGNINIWKSERRREDNIKMYLKGVGL